MPDGVNIIAGHKIQLLGDLGVAKTQAPIFPYDKNYWLDSLPAYDASFHTDLLLDQLRVLQGTGEYYWKGYAVPQGEDVAIAAFDNFEDNISVEPGTIITYITAYSQEAEGFKFQLFDRGANMYLFNRTYPQHQSVTGEMVAIGGVVPFGPYMLGANAGPQIVLDPGLLTVNITNLADADNVIQLLIAMSVPATRMSLSQNVGIAARSGGSIGDEIETRVG